jgi:5-methyltetrahydropteroyltriglutamate--homocysteine methyltransferase
MQEDVGLRVATDGEFRREMWHTDFLSQLINVEVVPGKIKVRFTSAEGETEIEPPGAVVTGKLGWPAGGIFVNHFKISQIGRAAGDRAQNHDPVAQHHAFSRRPGRG